MRMLFRSIRAPIALLALGVCAAFGFAQTPKPAAAPAAAPAADASPAQKKLDDIDARFKKAMEAWQAEIKNAKSQEDAEAIADKRPGDAFLDELEALAKESKGTDTAANAWARYVAIAQGVRSPNQVAKGLKVLVQEYVTSPALADVADMIPRSFKSTVSEEFLRRMIDKSPDKKVQASAMLALGQQLMGEKKPTPERTAEGRALLEKVRKDYTGIKSSRDEEYAAIADGQLYELEHLQIGQTPADFEVTDENGVKFKLSDYRGKVVVIDFWGNW